MGPYDYIFLQFGELPPSHPWGMFHYFYHFLATLGWFMRRHGMPSI